MKHWKPRRRLVIEALEDRTVPTGSFDLTPNFDIAHHPLGTYSLAVTGDQEAGNLNDTVTLDGDPSGGVVVSLNARTIHFLPGYLTAITVSPGAGTNVVDVERDVIPVRVSIALGSGTNTVNLSPTAHQFGNLEMSLDVTGFAGPGAHGPSTLNVYDSADGANRMWWQNSSSLSSDGTPEVRYSHLTNLNVFGGNATNSWTIADTLGAEHTTLRGGTRDDYFSVQAATAGTTLTVYGGAGSNQTTLGASWNSLARILGNVEVQGNGTDTITLKDRNAVNPLGTTYTVTPTAVTRVAPSSPNAFHATTLTYGGVRTLTINGARRGAAGIPVWNVVGLGTTGSTILNTAPGANVVNLSPTEHNLDGFLANIAGLFQRSGRLDINGTGSVTTVNVNDQNDVGMATTYTLAASTLTRIDTTQGPPPLGLPHVATVTVGFTNPGGTTMLNVNPSNKGSTIRVQEKLLNATVQLAGGAGIDTLVGPDAANTWALTAPTGAGTLNGTLAYTGVENLTGGARDDRFLFREGALQGTFTPVSAVPGVINGGGGANTLDYSALHVGVTVNLTLGQADWVFGGIANIQNVTGGRGNDVLVGNDAANVLRGGAGRNLLIGGRGADTLNQPGSQVLGEDLLIADATDFDANAAALAALEAEWSRTDLQAGFPPLQYQARVYHLLYGGGLNRGFLLSAAVHADGAADTLTSSSGTGLDFFALDGLDQLTRPLKFGERTLQV